MEKTIVIGAGITGLFTSYYLAKDGQKVILIDRYPDRARTSIYNAGFITPSTGAVPSIGMGEIVGSFFGRGGPMYISLLEVFRNIKWFRVASRKALSGYEKAISELGRDSLERYASFFKEEWEIRPDIVDGVAALFMEEEKAREAAKATKAKFLDSKEILESGYQGLNGGAYVEEEFSIHPQKLYDGLLAKLVELGVEIRRGQDAVLNPVENGSVEVTLGGEKIPADNYVVTSGSWSGDLLKRLNYNPLIAPARGLVMLFNTGGQSIVKIPALLEDYGMAISQHNKNTVRITSFFELVHFNDAYKESRKRWLIDVAKKHVTKFSELKFSSEGVGFRPCTPDQLPVIGRVPGYQNLYIASGNCRLGVTLAPATANIIRTMMESPSKKEAFWTQFDPARFS